jgi:hypothetical protein
MFSFVAGTSFMETYGLVIASFDQKNKIKNLAVNFINFWSSKPWIWIRIGIQPKMLDLDPDPESMNPDPKQ